MSLNINQIFTANPASSMISTDLLYLGRSPYNTSDDFAITFANFVASIGTATPTASTIVKYDANVNISANNFLAGYQTIATASGTTVLTVASPYTTYFTGTSNQTVTMPAVSTLALNQQFEINNSSTGIITINSSGGNTIVALRPNQTAIISAIALTGTTATSWAVFFNNNPLTRFVWTPAFTFATPGNLSVSYTGQTGLYTQVGALIFFSFTLNFTPTFTTGSGNIQITGLPFISSAAISGYGCGSVANSASIIYPAGCTALTLDVELNTQYIRLMGNGSATGFTVLTASNITTAVACSLVGSGFYNLV